MLKNTKTFVTVIAQQGIRDGKSMLQPVRYSSSENEKLEYRKEGGSEIEEIRFPITAAINGYTDSEDVVKVIAIRSIHDENLMYNWENFFLPEMEKVREEKGIEKDRFRIEYIDMETFLGIDATVELFEELLNKIGDHERLHACITFGTKPLPMILFAALNYAYKVRVNTGIECILYGNLHAGGAKRQPQIDDMTPLFYTNALFTSLAELGDPNPVGRLRKIRAIEWEEEE